MSKYTEEAASILKDIQTRIQEISDAIGAQPEATDLSIRLMLIFGYAKKLLDLLQAELTPLSTLNGLKTNFANLATYYKQNNQASINTTADEILRNLNILTTKSMADFQSGLTESFTALAEQYSNQQKKLVENLQKEEEALKAKLKVLDDRISVASAAVGSEKTRIDNLSATLQQQFTAAQEDRRVKFETEISNIRNTNNKDYEKAKADYATYVAQATGKLEAQKTAFDGFVAKIKENESKMLKEWESAAKNTLSAMENLRQDSQKLLGIVASNAYAGNYKKYADVSEKKAAWLFRIGMLLLTLAVVVITWPLIERMFEQLPALGQPMPEFDYKTLLYRVPASLVLLLPGAYLLHEATRQRDMAFQYRDFEIKVAASEPYISKISATCIAGKTISEQDEIRKQLAKSFFEYRTDIKKDEDIVVPKKGFEMIMDLLKQVIKH